jgi:hypothetical protein
MEEISEKKLAILQDQMADGAEARKVLDSLGPHLEHREIQLLREMVAVYDTNGWDESTIHSYVARLAETRAHIDALNRRALKGEHARERLFGGSTAG